MRARTSTRVVAFFAVLIAVSWIVPRASAGNLAYSAPPAQPMHVVASDAASQSIALGIGKSVVVGVPRDIRDVLVADPKIANSVVRSSRRAYIIGAGVGQTNVFFFDAEGRQIGGFDIAVKRDLNGIREAIHQVLKVVVAEVERDGHQTTRHQPVRVVSESGRTT